MQNKDKQVITDDNSILELSILSVIGDREDQQDSYGYSLKEDGGIITICDGMGGYQGGKTASSTAVNIIISAYNDHYPCADLTTLLLNADEKADKKIYAIKDAKGKSLKSGSTAVTVVVKNGILYWCSVGDSRAYLFRNGEFAQITQDQNYKTVLDEQRSVGTITQKEYDDEAHHGEALISFLGMGNLQLVDYNTIPFKLEKKDKIILMSDGLYKLLSNEEMAKIIENFSNITEALEAFELKAAKKARDLAKNRDNMTVALIKIK